MTTDHTDDRLTHSERRPGRPWTRSSDRPRLVDIPRSPTVNPDPPVTAPTSSLRAGLADSHDLAVDRFTGRGRVASASTWPKIAGQGEDADPMVLPRPATSAWSRSSTAWAAPAAPSTTHRTDPAPVPTSHPGPPGTSRTADARPAAQDDAARRSTSRQRPAGHHPGGAASPGWPSCRHRRACCGQSCCGPCRPPWRWPQSHRPRGCRSTGNATLLWAGDSRVYAAAPARGPPADHATTSATTATR